MQASSKIEGEQNPFMSYGLSKEDLKEEKSAQQEVFHKKPLLQLPNPSIALLFH